MAIESLFGASVADIQELRRQQAERDIAGAGQEFGVFAPLYQAGLRFGNQAVGGINTLLGVQDPMLKKATDIQSILSQYQDQDLTSQDTLSKISKDLAKAGYSREAMMASQEASKAAKLTRAEKREETKLDIQLAELGVKTKTAERQAQKDERDLLEFFKKNPEQASTALQTLAAQIEVDPTNQTLLNRYNNIAQASAAGNLEEASKTAKEALNIESIKTTIEKNKKELRELDFNAGMRWNAERESALALFRANNLDPTQPLKGSALINTELVNAQRIALRDPWIGGVMPSTPTATGTPQAAGSAIKARVEAAGQVYEPNKYDYRVGPTGQVERRLKQQ